MATRREAAVAKTHPENDATPPMVHGPQPWARKELLRRAYAEAANDNAYASEMAEIDCAFDVTVGDGLD